MATVLTALLRWMVVSSLRASVLVLVVALLAAGGRRWLRPQWTYGLWLLVFVPLALPRVPLGPLTTYHLSPAAVLRGLNPSPAGTRTTPLSASLASTPAGSAVGAGAHATVSPPSTWQAWLGAARWAAIPGWVLVGAGVWLAGLLFFGGRVWLAERRFRQQLHQAVPVNDPRALELWSASVRHTVRRRAPTLWQVPGIRSPLLYGGIRPRLFLPAALVGQLSDAELEHVFYHELTHDLRRDIWANWGATVLSLVHWFNPLVWWGLARMTDAQEIACDATTVARLTTAPALYGHTLVRVLELTHIPDPHIPSVAGMMRKASLHRMRVLALKRLEQPAARWSVAITAAVAAACSTALVMGVGSAGGSGARPAPVAVPPTAADMHRSGVTFVPSQPPLGVISATQAMNDLLAKNGGVLTHFPSTLHVARFGHVTAAKSWPLTDMAYGANANGWLVPAQVVTAWEITFGGLQMPLGGFFMLPGLPRPKTDGEVCNDITALVDAKTGTILWFDLWSGCTPVPTSVALGPR